MKDQISLDDIFEFSNEYNSCKSNKEIENRIVKLGLEEACYNDSIVKDNPFSFNLELEEGNIYDQKQNHKCWLYAGINFIKHNVGFNLGIDKLKNLELSEEYLAFFDKLEKTNSIYETVINKDGYYNDLRSVYNDCKVFMTEAGYFPMFVSLVNKYGIAPSCCMKHGFEDDNFSKIENVLYEKVKKDLIILNEMKRSYCCDSDDNEKMYIELESKKKEFLKENYFMLSKVLGEPVSRFDYLYNNVHGKEVKVLNISPIEFRDRFLKIDLNDFVMVGNFTNSNKEFNKVYLKSKVQNVYNNSAVKYLNLSNDVMKDLVVKQLKDGVPVWSGMYIRKGENEKLGVLDTRLYNYSNMIGLKNLSKEEALDLNDIFVHHVMTFCGVELDNDIPLRWKVEDSYGENEKIRGYYVMNDNFFDKFVFMIAVNKKYLSSEQLNLLEGDYLYQGEDEVF